MIEAAKAKEKYDLLAAGLIVLQKAMSGMMQGFGDEASNAGISNLETAVKTIGNASEALKDFAKVQQWLMPHGGGGGAVTTGGTVFGAGISGAPMSGINIRSAMGHGASMLQGAGASQVAQKQLGHPYSQELDNGVGPEYFDCSGLMQSSYDAVGHSIPRRTYEQKDFAVIAPWEQGRNSYWQKLTRIPGSLLFAEDFSHVGMATGIGGGGQEVIHAGSGGVGYTALSKYWNWAGWPLKQGMESIPYDNFPAILHKNERVLTASEARGHDSGLTYVDNSTVTINGADASVSDIKKMIEDNDEKRAGRIKNELRRYGGR